MFTAMRKRCGKCKRNKKLDDFYVKDAKRGTRQSYCKACFAARHKKYYESNKTYYKEKRVRNLRQLKELIAKLKNKPCADCKRKFPPYAMDFDHTGNDKIGDVSTLAGLGYKTAALEEVKKCDVVCAVCHRIRTYKRTYGERGSGVDHLDVAQA